MASYEEVAAGEVAASSFEEMMTSINDSDALSPDVKDLLGEILSSSTTTVAGEEVVNVLNFSNDMEVPTSTIPAAVVAPGVEMTNAAVAGQAETIIMLGDSSANLTFAPDAATTVIAVGSGGNSNIAFTGDKDITVNLQGGQNDTIALAKGNDNVTFAGGSATVDTGEGNDNVRLQAAGDVAINSGDGDLTIYVNPGATFNATIDAGDGFDKLAIADDRANHDFEFKDGRFIMHSDGEFSMTGVNAVAWETDGDGVLTWQDNVTFLASTYKENIVAKLYKVGLGREALDQGDDPLGGYNWWINTFDPNGTVENLVYTFQTSEEFQNLYANATNTEFVQALFNNIADGTTAVKDNNGVDHSVEDYVAQLDSGALSRYDVTWLVADSETASDVLGADGEKYVIEGDYSA